MNTKGAPTLWGSFEIQNKRLVQKMLQQYCSAGRVEQLPPGDQNALADDFEELPLKFMNFYGSSSLDEVSE